MKHSISIIAITVLASAGLRAETNTVRGVNPADNLTKFEILPKFSMVDDGGDVSVSTMTFKCDRAFQGIYGLNFEIPVTYFDSPLTEDFGIGDLNVRGRYQHRADEWTFIAGAEAVFPTASEDTLGGGKFQLNPVAVVVYAFSEQTFAAVAAKHLFSIAGDSDRADIVQGQYRCILARTTPSGWWFLADPQFWADYDNDSRVQLSLDMEVGRMINQSTGIWLRGGSRIAGDWEKEYRSISTGIRFIAF